VKCLKLVRQNQAANLRPFSLHRLAWQHQTLSLQHLGDVEVEEVNVEHGLYNASQDSNGVEESLVVVSVHPVENVKSAVRTKHEQVVACNSLGFSSLRHHEQLRKDCSCFQIDGERPEDLSCSEGMVEDEAENNTRSQQEFNSERIVVTVVRWFELHKDEVAGPNSTGDVDYLHDSVIH